MTSRVIGWRKIRGRGIRRERAGRWAGRDSRDRKGARLGGDGEMLSLRTPASRQHSGGAREWMAGVLRKNDGHARRSGAGDGGGRDVSGIWLRGLLLLAAVFQAVAMWGVNGAERPARLACALGFLILARLYDD